jgi:hypothetical protein
MDTSHLSDEECAKLYRQMVGGLNHNAGRLDGWESSEWGLLSGIIDCAVGVGITVFGAAAEGVHAAGNAVAEAYTKHDSTAQDRLEAIRSFHADVFGQQRPAQGIDYTKEFTPVVSERKTLDEQFAPKATQDFEHVEPFVPYIPGVTPLETVGEQLARRARPPAPRPDFEFGEQLPPKTAAELRAEGPPSKQVSSSNAGLTAAQIREIGPPSKEQSMREAMRVREDLLQRQVQERDVGVAI